MKINSLRIKGIDVNSNNKIFEQPVEYTFSDVTLVTSKGKNSRGKTTLMRFIIFALGFKIPLTDGVSKNRYKTELEFTKDNKNYTIKREENEIRLTIDGREVENEGVEYFLNFFNLTKEEELDNILGCFYIDQEKGWTLLNRGRVIGKRHFSIEDLITIINKLDKVVEEKLHLKNIEVESQKIKILKNIKNIKDKSMFKEDKKTLNLLEEREELERLKNKVLSIKNYIKSLNDAIEDHKKFFLRLKRLGLKVRIEGKIYPIDDENIIGMDLEDSFAELEKEELEKQLQLYQRKINELRQRIDVKTNLSTTEKLDELIQSISIEENEYQSLQEREKKNTKLKREINKSIKMTLNDNIEEFWLILRKVLIDLKLPEEYITPSIVLDNKLSGKTGTLLHSLTFGYKLSLLIYLEKKYKIKLPFIIDSPRSGEVNLETSNLMMSLTKKYLGENQIIVSSVFQNYDINFDSIISLNNGGVLGSRDKFIYQ